MELLTNDLSIHEQFHDIASFRGALARLMKMRAAAQRFGRELYCHRAFLTTSPMPNVPMQQAVGRLSVESERRAAMGWLTRAGPFWDDLRQHGAEDWLECCGDIVTDTAVGEASFRTLDGVECDLVSVTPSNWNYAPVDVTWCREGGNDPSTPLQNWWSVPALEDRLRERAPPIQSWDALREASTKFQSLTFAGNCFMPLDGVPFAKSAAERLLKLFDILNRFACVFNADGARTPQGQQIYQEYFTGDNALFSDSSDSEKNRFRNELTFRHPNDSQKPLFCTWHGKVRHPMLRLHFSWPVKAGQPIYIVYAGPKITKK